MKKKCDSYIEILNYLKMESQETANNKCIVLLRQVKSDAITQMNRIELFEKDCDRTEQQLLNAVQLIEKIKKSKVKNKTKLENAIKMHKSIMIQKHKLLEKCDLLEKDLNKTLCTFYNIAGLKLDEIERTIKSININCKLTYNEHLLSQAKNILKIFDENVS